MRMLHLRVWLFGWLTLSGVRRCQRRCTRFAIMRRVATVGVAARVRGVAVLCDRHVLCAPTPGAMCHVTPLHHRRKRRPLAGGRALARIPVRRRAQFATTSHGTAEGDVRLAFWLGRSAAPFLGGQFAAGSALVCGRSHADHTSCVMVWRCLLQRIDRHDHMAVRRPHASAHHSVGGLPEASARRRSPCTHTHIPPPPPPPPPPPRPAAVRRCRRPVSLAPGAASTAPSNAARRVSAVGCAV